MVEITINLERRTMKGRHHLAKRDIIVALVSVALLLTNLALIGSTGRRRAKETVCRSNLRQWGLIWHTFTNDDDGYFPEVESGWIRGKWITALLPQYETKLDLLRCPDATKRLPGMTAPYGGPFTTYVMGTGGLQDRGEEASYGANCWIYNPSPTVIARGEIQNRPVEWHWMTPHVTGGSNIPVFADAMWRGGGPFDGSPGPSQIPYRGEPPAYDGEWSGTSSEMKHFCINRHNGAVNHLFMDWSARKVGLKQLWTLKWHREFNTAGPWTLAGGITPQRDWPEWMKNFKDY
jgi:hypothetical protein